MLDDLLVYQPILFIVGSYCIVKLGGRFWRSGPRSLVLWCARMKCLSVVDTEATTSETGQSENVTHCLLWPELHGCDQRCIK
jgi:hypothetical protein